MRIKKLMALFLAVVMLSSMAMNTKVVHAAGGSWTKAEREDAFEWVLGDLNTGKNLGLRPYRDSGNTMQGKEPILQDADARKLAAEIVGTETDQLQKAKLIFNYVASKITHEEQKDDFGYHEREWSLSTGRGNCRTFAYYFQVLCVAAGVPCVQIRGDYTTSTGSVLGAHQWNAFYANGSWHWADPTGKSSSFFDMAPSKMTSEYYAEGVMGETKTGTWSNEDLLAAIGYKLLPYDTLMKWDIRESKTWGEVLDSKGYQGSRNWTYYQYRAEDTNYTLGCSREEFCGLAVRLLEEYFDKDIDQILADKGVTPGYFTDTNDKNVLACAALNIVNGVGQNRFNPYGTITRQEAAVILARTANVLGKTGGTPTSFSDVPAGHWAKGGIDFVSSIGVMNGVGGGKFNPTGTYTREQCVVTIVRMFEVCS